MNIQWNRIVGWNVFQCRSFLIAVIVAVVFVSPLHATPIVFFEDLGNFPDAIAVSAEFDTFGTQFINGIDITGKTGILFRLENTSSPNPADPAQAFRQDPDGDFATNDQLTPEAEAAISNAQPFGIYKFGTNMHPIVAAGLDDGSLMTSSPTGFNLNVEGLGGADPEINFQVSPPQDGLLFDDTFTGAIPSQFTNPRTGTLDFFIEVNLAFDDILDFTSASINERGLDIATEMAWGADTGTGILTVFSTLGSPELRPRGQLGANPVPEPSTFLLFGSGILGLVGYAWRQRRHLTM